MALDDDNVHNAQQSTTTATTTDEAAVESPPWEKDLFHQMQALAAAHGLPCRPTRKLRPCHQAEFQTTSNDNHADKDDETIVEALFHRLARVVCRVDCIPRKELFEAWSMARCLVHYFFVTTPSSSSSACAALSPLPPPTRIVDVAAGHGLLSWTVLLLVWELNRNKNDSNETRPPNLSAICIDTRMPQSADRLAAEILKEWPVLQQQQCWDYVQGPLQGIFQHDRNTLLMGLHACATLTDDLLQLAVMGPSPVAVMPCCHAKKCLSNDEPFDPSNPLALRLCLSDYLDRLRAQRLEAAGMNVTQVLIPDMITPKNRLLLARPLTATTSVAVAVHGNKWRQKCTIPVADTVTAREAVRAMAGRAKPKPIHLGLCIAVSSQEKIVTADELQAMAQNIFHEEHGDDDSFCRITVQDTNIRKGVYHDHATNSYKQSLRVIYHDIFDKNEARIQHAKIIEAIPLRFSGASIAQSPLKMQPHMLELDFCVTEHDPRTDVLAPQMHQAAAAIFASVQLQQQDLRYKVQLLNPKVLHRQNGQLLRHYRLYYYVQNASEAQVWHSRLREELKQHIPGIVLRPAQK